MSNLLLNISILLATFSIVDGGEQDTVCHINEYEYQYQQYYKSIDSQLETLNEKGKKEWVKGTMNIAITDLETEKTTFLFEKEDQFIQEFYFEKYLDKEKGQMVFNNDWSNFFKNNFGISREPMNLLLIKTFHPESKTYRLWRSKKDGSGLELVKRLDPRAVQHFDVRNKVVRSVKPTTDGTFEMENLKL